MDEFSVFGDSFQEALKNMEKLLIHCQEAHLTLSDKKCRLMCKAGVVLGHFISGKGIQVDSAKIEIILHLPTPKTQREVRGFLGHAGYYRRFIEIFSKIATLLFQLLAKDSEFSWSTACQQSFETLKEKLVQTPILRGPNQSLLFHISSDASDLAIGAALGQEENKKSYAIYYISKNLSSAELNYTVTEKEILVVIFAINKFRHFITGYEVFVHTDHFAIKYLMTKPLTSGRVTRWLLLLQEFNVTIVDRPGKPNVVADFISRLDNYGEATPVNDDFPYEHLFSMSIDSPWFADISNYLVTRKTPPHLSAREKRNIIQKSVAYSWIQGDLFYTGLDLIIRRCVREEEVLDILKYAHDEPCGGHFTDKRTAYKVFCVGYFWPSLFKNAKQYVR